MPGVSIKTKSNDCAAQSLDHTSELVSRPLDLGNLWSLARSRLRPLRGGGLLVHFQDADRVPGFLGGDGERHA